MLFFFFFLLVVYSKIHMNFKDKHEIQTETRKGFFMLFSFTFWFCCFSFFFFCSSAGINCAGSPALHLLCSCMCVRVCAVYMFMCLHLYCVYARCKNRKAKPATTWASVLPVLMAFGLFMLPRIRHTHTHTHRLAYWVTFSLQGFKFVVSVFLCVAFLTLQLTRGNFSIFSSLSRRSHLQLEVNWVTSTVG